jgi:hypothetical protein
MSGDGQIHCRPMSLLRPRALPAAAAALALAVPFAGCGHKEAITTFAKTEGIYVNVGPLIYQVQISRQLNPYDIEDAAYLRGIPNAKNIPRRQTWFAVFIRVQNERGTGHPSARQFEIVDTTDKIYRPVKLPRNNLFAYRPAIVPASGGILPSPESTAENGVIQGSELLFKLDTASLADRPLTLVIHSATTAQPPTGRVDLDV